MEKQRNGYGTATSLLSVSHVGRSQHCSEARQEKTRRHARELQRDVQLQTKHLATQHPYRKSLHLQKCYPDTLHRLQKSQMARDPLLQRKGLIREAPARPCHNHTSKALRGMAAESSLNRCKRDWNRHAGRRSEVHDIITGRSGPDPHPMLHPAGATHQQILVLEKKANSSDPNREPPTAPRPERRWTGDAGGWQRV